MVDWDGLENRCGFTLTVGSNPTLSATASFPLPFSIVVASGGDICYGSVMINNKTIAERAFELAREGKCRSLDDIRRQLTKEGFESVHSHLAGSLIGKQLKSLIPPLAEAEAT